MATKFDRYFRERAFPILKREFAEPIKYNLLAGGVRSIMAIINRSPPSFFDAAGNVVSPSFTIEIDNSCTTGVKSDEVNTGGDTVDLIHEIGSDQWESTTVLVLMSQDSGVVQLALR